MSNGKEDSSGLNMKSKKRLQLVTSAGLQPTQRSLDTAKSRQADLAASTSVTSLRCQFPKRSGKSEKQKAEQRYRILKSFSMNECARLDAMKIKILGIEFDIDHNDRSWAK